MILRGHAKVLKHLSQCTVATFSTTNLTCTGLGLNQDLCSEMSATDCMRYGTVCHVVMINTANLSPNMNQQNE